jgi:TatA/E family protein of Tat protein translocase
LRPPPRSLEKEAGESEVPVISVSFVGFLETLGTSELLVILVVALIVFGPRKLPEIGRTLGRSLGEFKRASEDFKRTWEQAADIERAEGRNPTIPSALPGRNEPEHSLVETDAASMAAPIEAASTAA